MVTDRDLNRCYQQLGFTEPPFRITPDTDYFFPGNGHLEALNHLRFGIASGGLTMLTGEVGVGKTLLCRYLLRHPPRGIRFAYLLNPDQSYVELLTSIHQDLTGIIPEDRSIGGLQRELAMVLFRLAQEGERVAVLVDEAHRLSPKVLEGLRLLSNLDTEKEKLLCLLFLGQPELAKILSSRALRPLNQRISVRYQLGPLEWQETQRYIQHRLWVAQRRPRFQFGSTVMALIHLVSRGVPRRINQLCDRALLAAYARHRYAISSWMIWQANREITGAVQ
jgi:general secretion pathway protein A